MDPLFGSLALLATVSGYGDVDPSGHPAWAERDMHLWTNAVRVAPEAFEAEYVRGGCSFSRFSSDEQTAKAPVAYSRDLNEVARLHSADMHANGALSHTSSDGTSFQERVSAHYPSVAIGENIAYNYADTRVVVTEGWMCSTEGHRENIMSGDWTELGTGVASVYYTQDFGAAPSAWDGAVTMGIHTPERPSGAVTFYADWHDAEAPIVLSVMLDGDQHDLSLAYGRDESGVYTTTVDNYDSDGCGAYWFRWETAAGQEGTFPEDGSYLFGTNCGTSVLWEDSQYDAAAGILVGGPEDEEPKGGCATATAPAALGAALGMLALLGRRRQRVA